MTGPIEDFLKEVGTSGSAEDLRELRGHLEESAVGFAELGMDREDAERAAIEKFGKPSEVIIALRKRHFEWKGLFGGDRKVLLTVGGVCFSVFSLGPMMFASGLTNIDKFVVPAVIFYWMIVFWTIWTSSRAKRVGPFAVTLTLLASFMISIVVISFLTSSVPQEVGGLAWRWNLDAKHTEFMAYNGEFWDHSVGGYVSRIKPGDLTYDVAKESMWTKTGGSGVLYSMRSLIVSQWNTMSMWLFLTFLSGVAGFFFRFAREGGYGRGRGWRVD